MPLPERVRSRRPGALLAAAGVLLGALATGPGAQAATRFDPYSVPIPAMCGHSATHLTDGRVSFGRDASGSSRGGASLVPRHGAETGRITDPVIAEQRGRTSTGAADALPIACSAGGVVLPETVVLYTRGGRVLAAKDLGRISRQEHADVTAISLRGHSVHVRWTAYEGAGFDVHHASATLVLHGRAFAVTRLHRG